MELSFSGAATRDAPGLNVPQQTHVTVFIPSHINHWLVLSWWLESWTPRVDGCNERETDSQSLLSVERKPLRVSLSLLQLSGTGEDFCAWWNKSFHRCPEFLVHNESLCDHIDSLIRHQLIESWHKDDYTVQVIIVSTAWGASLETGVQIMYSVCVSLNLSHLWLSFCKTEPTSLVTERVYYSWWQSWNHIARLLVSFTSRKEEVEKKSAGHPQCMLIQHPSSISHYSTMTCDEDTAARFQKCCLSGWEPFKTDYSCVAVIKESWILMR